MALPKKYIDLSDSTEEKVTTKLYIDEYNKVELEKSINLKVTELIKPLPEKRLDLVPKNLFDAEIERIKQLQADIEILNKKISEQDKTINRLLAESGSLFVENDAFKIQVAEFDNRENTMQTNIFELRTNLTTSLTKAINESTEKTALEAENQGLTAQKNALIKQIDTLNNLLAQANASIQIAQQQLSAKQQAVAAGGVSTGQLATLLWEKGDPSKNGGGGYAIDVDLTDGGAKVYKAAGYAAAWSSNFVEVVAGAKDINVKITQTFFSIESSFSLKANATKKITFDKPIQSKVPSGKKFLGFIGAGRKDYEETLTIEVTNTDAGGSTETKTFKVKVHSYPSK